MMIFRLLILSIEREKFPCLLLAMFPSVSQRANYKAEGTFLLIVWSSLCSSRHCGQKRWRIGHGTPTVKRNRNCYRLREHTSSFHMARTGILMNCQVFPLAFQSWNLDLSKFQINAGCKLQVVWHFCLLAFRLIHTQPGACEWHHTKGKDYSHLGFHGWGSAWELAPVGSLVWRRQCQYGWSCGIQRRLGLKESPRLRQSTRSKWLVATCPWMRL